MPKSVSRHLAAVEQDVGGLEVAVHDARRVCRGERGAGLRCEFRRLGRVQRPAAPLAVRGQVAVGDEVHHQGELVALDDHVVQHDHVRVPEAEQRGPLAHEPGYGRRILSMFGPQHLDRVGGPGYGVGPRQTTPRLPSPIRSSSW